MRQTFTYGQEQFSYEVAFTKKKIGKIAIHVFPDASVRVDAPEGETASKVHAAVLKRARWIKRHVNDARALREDILPRDYVSGETFFYLGRRYQLKVRSANGVASGVKFYRGAFHVTANKDKFAVSKQLRKWYRERAEEMFSRRFDELTSQLRWLKEVPSWRMVAMKKQWGSCSPAGAILLNPHLIKAPRKCIDYVILHELCHLKEHNHSSRFYRMLSQAMPDWKRVKSQLDNMAELYLNE
ncbi:putative metal-dependent hydrolase [Bradyrhizobium liaoningense]|uniref:M48 family metallopeptidase n=1 Tax=Bradyrhizobium liaoningense TaxID=43992 RepID=UPI00235DBF9B|nr:SprT family zinc-dependent metalloprotease [Bradyrhizobium liaoningense]GLR97618.1 metal-dependent hydrolase [Bradyrhizobium liaoningense]